MKCKILWIMAALVLMGAGWTAAKMLNLLGPGWSVKDNDGIKVV